MTAQSGYVIAAQAALSIEVDEFGDVILRQDKSTIIINSTNLTSLIDILINIDDGTGYDQGHRVDWEATLPDLDSPPTIPAKPKKKDRTAAERQRRRRAKRDKRDSRDIERDINRDKA
jgi:hypothetical protein